MSDETTEPNAAEAPTPEPTGGDKKDKKIAALIAEINKRDDAIKATAAMDREAKAEREKKAAVKKADYEAAALIDKDALTAKDAEIAALQATIKNNVTTQELSTLLAGTDPYFQQAKVAEYLRTDPDERKSVEEHVAALREAEPDRFNTKPPAPKSAGHSGAVAPAANNAGSLEERVANGDVDAQREMLNKLLSQ
ncbi:MAG: hypothetical protein GY851_09475 [bacterium]|nr:hypothetical protein [bacterium]